MSGKPGGDGGGATLWVVGTPLDESAPLSAEAAAALGAAAVIIGESRKVAFHWITSVAGAREKPVFLLDRQRPEDREAMSGALRALARDGGAAALFSDGGMPILFDPGADVLSECRRLGFTIRSAGAQTSWGTACALSGLEAPFLVLGFLPRDNEERRVELKSRSQERAHLVLMDTPYRFLPLLGLCREVLGGDRPAFLAWELAKPEESLAWGTLRELEGVAKQRGWQKGEFVLIVHGASPAARSKGAPSRR